MGHLAGFPGGPGGAQALTIPSASVPVLVLIPAAGLIPKAVLVLIRSSSATPTDGRVRASILNMRFRNSEEAPER